jgi:hypothetical protein
MIVHPFTPEPAEVLPSKRDVAFRAGHKALPSPDDPMYAPLAAAYREGTRLITPRGAWVTLPAADAGTLPAEFAGVARVTLGVTTLGPALDDAIAAHLDAGRTLPGVLLDAFGSEAVEEVTDALDAFLRASHGPGTRRFSPGYGDLSILENAAILARLGVDFVAASPATGILTPRKSTVFLIGWHEEQKEEI